MKTAHNEHTGAKLQSKVSNKEYRNNYDLIFGKKHKPKDKCSKCECDGGCKNKASNLKFSTSV